MEKPDLFHLRAIGAAYSRLPYENVTKILKDARSTSSELKLRAAEEVLDDHLRWNTGGTCFSLCNALLEVLEFSGFHAFIGMADMHYGENIHCAVIAVLPEGRYLMDPGYLLNEPMLLPQNGAETVTETPMNVVILRSEGPDIVSLFTRESGQEKWRYRLRSWPVTRKEFRMHRIESFHLNSMEHVMLSLLDDSGRLYFRKDRLDYVNQTERKKSKTQDSVALSNLFGVPKDLIVLAQKAVLIRPERVKIIL